MNLVKLPTCEKKQQKITFVRFGHAYKLTQNLFYLIYAEFSDHIRT